MGRQTDRTTGAANHHPLPASSRACESLKPPRQGYQQSPHSSETPTRQASHQCPPSTIDSGSPRRSLSLDARQLHPSSPITIAVTASRAPPCLRSSPAGPLFIDHRVCRSRCNPSGPVPTYASLRPLADPCNGSLVHRPMRTLIPPGTESLPLDRLGQGSRASWETGMFESGSPQGGGAVPARAQRNGAMILSVLSTFFVVWSENRNSSSMGQASARPGAPVRPLWTSASSSAFRVRIRARKQPAAAAHRSRIAQLSPGQTAGSRRPHATRGSGPAVGPRTMESNFP